MAKQLQAFAVWRLLVLAILLGSTAQAQTDIDAIMMEKHAFCVGPSYSYSSFKNYWEGTRKRNNLNMGRVSTRMFGLMGDYGITKKLNALFGLPYVRTRASAGTLHGLEGVQDLSLFLKWNPVRRKWGEGVFSAFAIGGFSLPLSNYVVDYLPLSIGLHTRNLLGRVMADYQRGNWFVTGSATYVYRSNTRLDRNSYYTTEMIDNTEVEMPDAMSFNLRAGLRSYHLIAEGFLNNWTTLGGFDITRNNMPFPSNRMNATSLGVNVKYTPTWAPRLSLVGTGSCVVTGRNMGQATTVDGAIFYVFDLSSHKKSSSNNPKM